jgi:hypothetical protein
VSEVQQTPQVEALLDEIRGAFQGVSRAGGLSWKEAILADYYADEEEMAEARDSQTDSSWEELVDAPIWDEDKTSLALVYLDPISFRYYIAAAMAMCLKGRSVLRWLPEGLTLPEDLSQHRGKSFKIANPLRFDARRFWLDKWSILNERQCRCIRSFLEYMSNVDILDPTARQTWSAALHSYWIDFGEGGSGVRA